MLINLTQLQEPYLVEIIFYDSIKLLKDSVFHTHSRVEICVSRLAYMITKTSYVGKAMISVITHNINGESITEFKVKYRGKWVRHGVETLCIEGHTQTFLYKYGEWINRC